jgi:hypothetical protein
MAATARATFELKSFDEETVVELDAGGKITRATITRALSGDIEGEAVWETVMAYGADGNATIVGLERVVGSVGGRSGSLVLTTEGDFDGQEMRSTTQVLADLGGGDLAGLRGTGSTSAPHGPTGTYVLEYELD